MKEESKCITTGRSPALRPCASTLLRLGSFTQSYEEIPVWEPRPTSRRLCGSRCPRARSASPSIRLSRRSSQPSWSSSMRNFVGRDRLNHRLALQSLHQFTLPSSFLPSSSKSVLGPSGADARHDGAAGGNAMSEGARRQNDGPKKEGREERAALCLRQRPLRSDHGQLAWRRLHFWVARWPDGRRGRGRGRGRGTERERERERERSECEAASEAIAAGVRGEESDDDSGGGRWGRGGRRGEEKRKER